jgi:putative Ca2+/H+ antiporter (TMEM165/GDT1 family)
VGVVKEFAIYTLMRLLLFVAVLAVVLGLWILVFGEESSLLWPLVVSFVISGVLSVSLLNRPREAFARKVESRAQRAASRFEERRSAED